MLEVKNLVKVYSTKGGVKVRALDDVSVKFPDTGMVFLLGKSGSGKSTLLNVAGGLDKPDSGEIIVKGRSSKKFSASDFDSYRNTCVGFVFQEYNILNEFSIEQNVALALQLQNKRNDKKAVNALLEEVDLKGLGKRKPNTLSGGQKQRVAIARALIKSPEIIMADEPTGALDSNTGKQVLDTLKKLSKTRLVIIVSHDRDFAEIYGDRIIELCDGKIIEDVSKTYAKPVSVSENVCAVSDDTITVSDAEKITESDVKAIVAMLKNNGGEAVITTSKYEMGEVKRACKINSDGSKESFKKTGDVAIKDYDGKSTKFIRSHLPVSHAFRIGASGLRVKPFRLIFTILLCSVAFIMFGLFSTLMLFDKDKTLYQSIDDANMPVVIAKKAYQTKYIYDDYSYYDEKGTKMTETELAEFRSRFGQKTFGALSVSGGSVNLVSSGSKPDEKADVGAYYVNKVSYFACAKEGDAIRKDLKSGNFPVADNEICISSYTASVLIATYESLKTEDDLLGREIEFKNDSYGGENKRFVIKGVFDSGDKSLSVKYEKYKKPLDYSGKDYNESEIQKMLSEISDGYHSCAFVTEATYNRAIKEKAEKVDPLAKKLAYGGASAAYYQGEAEYDFRTAQFIDGKYLPEQYETIWVDSSSPKIENGQAVASVQLFYSVIISFSNLDVDKVAKTLSVRGFDSSKVGNWIYDSDVPEVDDGYYPAYEEFIKIVTDKDSEFYTAYALNLVNRKTFNMYGIETNTIDWLQTVAHSRSKGEKTFSAEENAEILKRCVEEYKAVLNDFSFNLNIRYYNEKGMNVDPRRKIMKIAGVSMYSHREIFFLSEQDNADLFKVAEERKAVSKAPEAESKYVESKDGVYDVIFCYYSSDKKAMLNIFTSEFGTDDSRYVVGNAIGTALEFVNSIVDETSKIFMWVGIVVGVFAMLLLANFISTSISHKKKEIGILRAVGARGSDVFKIFFAEAFLIDLICLLISTVGCVVICGIMNRELVSVLSGVSLFVFDGLPFAIMCAVALCSSVVSTFLPVFLASKKPPVESIRAL